MPVRRILAASTCMIALAAGAAANEPINLNMMPTQQTAGGWSVGGDASFDWLRLPAHGNGVIQFDFTGGGVQPQFLQADAEGFSYTLGLARDFAGGWRLGLHGNVIDADGSSSTRFQIPDGTPYVHGLLGGTNTGSGTYGGTGTADQTLDVEVSGFALGASAGQVICEENGRIARADLSFTYRDLDTDYLNTQYDFVFDELHVTTTSFETRSFELVGHVSGSIPLGSRFHLGGGASAGFAFKDFEMDASSNRLDSDFSALHAETDKTGFVARLEANVSYDITQTISAAIAGGMVYDSAVAAYVAPDYLAGTPARLDTKNETSPYAGVRVNARF